jgi:hypothetical protein
MRFKTFCAFLCFSVASVGAPGLSAPVAAAEIIERVLAVVNGSIITLSEAHAATRFGLVGSADTLDAVVDRLIDRRLALTEIDRYAPPEPTAEKIDEALAGIEATFASPDQLRAALAATGLTMVQLRRHARDELRIRAYEQERFGYVMQPSEEEALTYYRANPAQFTTGGVLRPFDDARADVRAALLAERRSQLAREWLAGLRRRANISVLPAR